MAWVRGYSTASNCMHFTHNTLLAVPHLEMATWPTHKINPRIPKETNRVKLLAGGQYQDYRYPSSNAIESEQNIDKSCQTLLDIAAAPWDPLKRVHHSPQGRRVDEARTALTRVVAIVGGEGVRGGTPLQSREGVP